MTFAAKRVHLLLLPLALSLTGCGIGNVLPSSDASDPTVVPSYTITGTVHGPHTVTGHTANPKVIIPVSNATVYLYAAGTSGYGSAATLLAETTTSTDGSATFSFTQNSGHTNSLTNISNTYACPTYTFTSQDGSTATLAKDSLLYIVVAGGDTQDGGSGTAHNNTASVLMAALGDCANAASLFVNVDEVTTVASVFALAPYISPIYPTATVTLTGYGATATPTLNSGGLASVAVNTGGYLYTTAPTVVITDSGGGTGATATATVANGAVTGVNVTAPGTGYTGATTISFTSANTSGTATLVGGALGTSTSYMTGYGAGTNGGYTPTGTKKTAVTAPLGYVGMLNAFATVNNLVTLSTGAAVASFSNSAALTGGTVLLTGTPEQAKLNTIADILAGCVDSSGPSSIGCATNLFAYAKPPISSASTSLGSGTTFTTATDTLQAAWYMATNPTDNTTYGASTAGSSTNLGNMFGNVTSQSNFQPVLSTQPTDWTLSIAYSSTSTCGTDTTKTAFLNASPYVAVTDLGGNVAVFNGSGIDTLVELTNSGTPSLCYFGTFGGGKRVAFDIYDNLWFTGNFSSSGLGEITIGGTKVNWPTTDGTNTYAPYALAADGLGNIFYTTTSYANGATTSNGLQEFAGAQATTTPANSTAIGSTTTTTPYVLYYIAADASGDIWAPVSGSGSEAYTWTKGSSSYTKHVITGSAGNFYIPYGAAFDSSGNFYTANSCCTSASGANLFVKMTPYTTSSTVSNNATYAGGGLIGSRSVATDGAGNIWASPIGAPTSYTATSTSSTCGTTSAPCGIYGMVEVDSSFNSLSPNGSGSSGCTTGNATACNIGGGYQKATLGPSRGIAIDISGNVWVPSDLSGNSVTNSFLTEIVGAAVPVVQSLAIAARDNKLGTKP
jgi:hypothetical protein